jgi:hypothetical protein
MVDFNQDAQRRIFKLSCRILEKQPILDRQWAGDATVISCLTADNTHIRNVNPAIFSGLTIR